MRHRRVVLAEAETGEDATLDLAIFRIIRDPARDDNPTGEEDLAAVMRRSRGVAGVNGGYFDPQNAPVGLLISDGKLIAPFRQSGVAQRRPWSSLRADGIAFARRNILRDRARSPRCNVRPFLVDGGQPVAGLNDTRSARRTSSHQWLPIRARVGFVRA